MRQQLVPPRELIDMVGGGDYSAIGDEFLRLYTTIGHLEPTERVLDLGCGCGRMAVPLLRHLSTGTYRGFDVHRDAIAWCDENIAAHHPNFKFDYVDAYNSLYNPEGTVRSESYRFPYEDGSFDFAAASSLFTHLVTAETAHYLAETARVLRPGGRCMFTFFLLMPDAEQLMAEGRSTLLFPAEVEGCRLASADGPANAVAYAEDGIRSLFAAAGLPVVAIHPGSWCGRDGTVTYQDMVVAERR